MRLGTYIGIVGILSVISLSGCKREAEKSPEAAVTQAGHEDPEGYYTCSMHPQVHEHAPGNCPICGMALVKVAGSKPESKKESKPGASNEIQASDQQLSLAGIGRHKVSRRDLEISIPVSGRITSSREIAFQVYESDLQVVKAGLEFQGSAASGPNEDVKGRVRQVDNFLDPSSRTVRVLGTLDKPISQGTIDGGFHGEFKIQVMGQIAIPEDAVLHTGTRDLIYQISSDNRLKPVAVTLGRKASGFYQVLSGINEGDVISSGPNFLIDSEAKIRGVSDQTHH